MAREIVIATDSSGTEARFVLEVFQEGDRWTSSLSKLNARGEPEPGRVAPRFYGMTLEQARRKMINVLEDQYEDVRPDTAEGERGRRGAGET